MHLFHKWEYIYPDPPQHGNYPYRKCKTCGEKRLLGESSRYFINPEGEWEYDDAMYGPP